MKLVRLRAAVSVEGKMFESGAVASLTDNTARLLMDEGLAVEVEERRKRKRLCRIEEAPRRAAYTGRPGRWR